MRIAATTIALIGSLILTMSSEVSAQDLTAKKSLNLAVAKKIAAAAEAEARKNNWNVVITVLDEGANLLYLQRMDGTQIGSVDVAIAKAASAVKFKRATKVFEDALKGGRQAILKLPGAIPVEGGEVISADGAVIGAIGVSGVQSDQDGIIARAGVAVVK
ncbi:MAG: heme-binding protein [Acidobacteria bacterium]|nr:heme-binding protein [Acidobacteriota bacterium]